jgi:NNP family nitrate/nitrite transporter-like MFS transporter
MRIPTTKPAPIKPEKNLGSTYFKPKKSGAMEVSSYSDLALYIVMNIPLYLALSLLTWKLSPANMLLMKSLPY